MKSEFGKLNIFSDGIGGKPTKIIWDDLMTSMLGNTFNVLPKLIGKNHPEIIALPSPDGSLGTIYGSQNGQWYFPKTVLTKVGK